MTAAISLVCLATRTLAPAEPRVDFSTKLRRWDGFGVNATRQFPIVAYQPARDTAR